MNADEENGNSEFQFDFAADRGDEIPTASVSRHTRGVKIARILFPVIAIGILVSLAIIPFFSETTVIRKNEPVQTAEPVIVPGAVTPENPAPPEADSGALQMTNPHFDGLDNKGRPFTVTADNVVQDGSNITADMTLANPVADMQVKPDQSMALTARVGVYSQDKQSLDLNGDVSLYHDNGYNLTGQSMQVDLAGGNADTKDHAFLQGEGGSIAGEGGMEFRDFGNHITFKGPAKLILKPQKDKP